MNRVVIDELHLMLKITDVLMRNVIGIAQVYDIKETERARTYAETLIDSIKSCGITFNVWPSKTRKEELEWTSLRGSDRKKLIRQLPPKLTVVFSDDLGCQLMKHWMDFNDIYNLIGTSNPTDEDISGLERKALQWIDDFIKFPFDGFKKASVTPYMHIMAYHVPLMMKQHNGIKRFTGQVEKNNDCAKKHYFSGNHEDAARDILLTEGRIEELEQGCKRRKRNYNKRDSSYWHDGIEEKRRKQSLPDSKQDSHQNSHKDFSML